MEDKKSKYFIGAHVSTSGGVFKAPVNANKIGAKAFAMFVKNQRQWKAKDYDGDTITKFKNNLKEYGYDPNYIMPHAGYLINMANPDLEKWTKSYEALIDEMTRCNQLGLKYLNIHPGSHLGQCSLDEAYDLIAKALNEAIIEVPNIVIVLENTAGKGNTLGGTFEDLGAIISRVNNKKRVGILLDTCHTYDAGYDIRDNYEGVFKDFEEKVGFKYLKGVHINDSMYGLGSKKDRHEKLGEGELGLDFFKKLMNDKRFMNIPLTLETIEPELWPQEIETLYSLID